MIEICKMCNMVDSRINNGDTEGCVECCSIEQGFLSLKECDFNNQIFEDEDGNLYNNDNELVGSLL